MYTFLETAIKEAEKSPANCRHGCVIFVSNKIVSKGFNKPVRPSKTIRSHIHAEIDALFGLHHKIIKKATLMVIRINKSKELIQSRPCKRCDGILKRKGIRKIFYSNEVGKMVSM